MINDYSVIRFQSSVTILSLAPTFYIQLHHEMAEGPRWQVPAVQRQSQEDGRACDLRQGPAHHRYH